VNTRGGRAQQQQQQQQQFAVASRALDLWTAVLYLGVVSM